MTAEDAIKLLLTRFPSSLEHSVPRDAFFELAPPYHAYECFAAEIKSRAIDCAFLTQAAEFINESAESGDGMLDEAVHIGTLESVASDRAAAKAISQFLKGRAKDKLARIEREMYGREPS